MTEPSPSKEKDLLVLRIKSQYQAINLLSSHKDPYPYQTFTELEHF